MKVTWVVDDGYATGARKQITEIPDYEIDILETEEEKDDLICEYIQAEFDEKITWHLSEEDEK